MIKNNSLVESPHCTRSPAEAENISFPAHTDNNNEVVQLAVIQQMHGVMGTLSHVGHAINQQENGHDRSVEQHNIVYCS